MSKIYLFLSFFYVFFSLSLYAQPEKKNIDSLLYHNPTDERVRIINRHIMLIALHTEKTRIEKEEEINTLLQQARSFAEKNKDKRLLKEVRFIENNKYLALETDPRKRIIAHQDLIDNLHYPEDIMYKGVYLHLIGQDQFEMQEYGLAFENLLNAQKIFKEVGYKNVPNIGKYLHELALDHYFFKNYEEAIELMSTSIKLPKYHEGLDIQRYNTLGMAYFKTGRQDSALVYLNKAYQKAESYHINVWMGLTAGNIGNVYYEKQDYRSALPYFLKNYTLSKNSGHFEIPLNACTNLAKLYLATDSLQEAYRFIRLTENYFPKNASSKLGQQQGFENAKRQYYENYYHYYLKTDDYKNALLYRDSLVQAETAANSKYNAAIIKISQDKLQIQEKVVEIARKEQEKTDLRLRYTVSILAISILAVLGFSLYYTTRLRKKKEKQLWLAQQEITDLEKQKLGNELKRAKADVERFVQKVGEKNALVENVTQQLEKLKNGQANEQQQELTNTLYRLRETKILTDEDWETFQLSFRKLYPNFAPNIKAHFPGVTPSELRYLLLTKIGLSHKEMANALGVSTNAIAVNKHRICKKLELEEQETLQQWVDSVTEKVVTTSHI